MNIRIVAAILLLLGISLGAPLGAEEAPSANPYLGDIWTRSTLSGDWWGLRNDLAAKGVTLDTRQSAAVLVLEPAFGRRGALKTARKGVGDYTVTVHGRAAHSGLEIQKGHSAIVELARQITRIAGFNERKRGITVNPGVIQGGTRSNVVAAEASAVVDVRVAQMADAARVEKKFRSLRPFDPNCRLEISGGVNRPPLERSEKVVALFRLAQQVAREMGWTPQEAAVGGGSDGNFTAALGIPTLDGLGAVGDGAHALHESVVISELPRRTALLARLIETI